MNKQRNIFHPGQLIAYILLLILGAIAIFSIVPHDTSATTSQLYTIRYNYCDDQFAKLWFQPVPPHIQKLCKNRFQWNINRIKREFIINNYY